MPEVRPDVRALLAYLAGAGFPAVETQSPEAARAGAVQGAALADRPYEPTASVTQVDDGLLLDPREDTSAPSDLVLWFHGGGFVTHGIETHRSLAADVARRLGLPVLLVDYRLAPEHPFPAAHDDAEAAARRAAGDPLVTGLILAGDSAGGNLAISTTRVLRDDPAAVPVKAHLAIYPATDESRTYPSEDEFAEGYLLTRAGRAWYREQFKPDVDDPRASPLLADLHGMPPGVVLTAGLDPVRDEGRAYAAALTSAGVPSTFLEAAGAIHAFVVLRAAVPSVNDDIDRALAALLASMA